VLFAVSAYTLSGYAFGIGIPPGWGVPPAVMIAAPLALAWNRPVIAWLLSALSQVPVFLADEALVEHGPTLGSGLATVPWFMHLVFLLAQMPVVFLVALVASRAVSLLAGSITLVAGALVAVPRLAVDEIAMLQGMMTWAVATILAIMLGRIRLRLHQATGRLAAEHSRLQVLEERARIARELHDVVSHHMSVIAVQASTAPYRFRLEQSPELGREFRTIGDSARASLHEMREVVEVLRGRTDPAPGPAELLRLIESARVAGTPVRMELSRSVPDPGPQLAAVAYRIVQEGLSNVIRHAAGAATSVRIDIDGSNLLIEVINDRPPTMIKRPRTDGHGLIGMRERVASVGGTVQAGPTDVGGYRVRAVLPMITPPVVARTGRIGNQEVPTTR
jgi:signal transduction histidine kinase